MLRNQIVTEGSGETRLVDNNARGMAMSKKHYAIMITISLKALLNLLRLQLVSSCIRR
jgi:hypothetical protein